jgi:hypothetical protein
MGDRDDPHSCLALPMSQRRVTKRRYADAYGRFETIRRHNPEDGGLSQPVLVCYGFVRENAHD